MKSLSLILCIGVSGLLLACGGQESAVQDNPQYLTGLAFDAQPVAGAPVLAKCRRGSGSATTQADGKFSIAVRQLELPCMLELSIDNGKQKLHALSMQGEAVNITDLTELLATRVLRSELSDFFAHFNPDAISKGVTLSSITAAEEDVKSALHNVLKLSMLSDFHHISPSQQVPDLEAYNDEPKTVTYADKLGAMKRGLGTVQFSQISTLMRQEVALQKLNLNIDALLLTAGKQKWEAANLQNYHYSYGYRCFCGLVDVTVVVRNGRITEAYTRLKHVPVDRGINDKNIRTIQSLFDFADQAYVRQAVFVGFSFDTQYGYLKNINVNYVADIADDEIGIDVFDFGID
ncbi:DUF6174 domain-containing protein [Undibacterium flavidum]|uniref:Uncharacterized protein n=1 Tax=Undibacterium flavidum TaxID=2762297 RepID=A0ABR6YBH2_9BURK|nr:DUF6174 domain-containing protein [Undibacterium flavidum]MBC3873986.1 hypothetical protein [Undibacterium flavidum]